MSVSSGLGMPRTLAVGDATIAYRECGSGRPIVFVHGLLVNGDLWRDVVPLLAPRFHCIVPDWPLGSHALPLLAEADLRPLAVAKLVADFIAARDLRDVVLVGSNTGGAICQLVISEHPQRIGALVLANCDAYENFFPPAFRALTYLARIPGFIDLLASGLRSERLQRLICATVAHRKPAAEILRSYFEPLIMQPGVRRDARKFIAAVDRRYTLEAARSFARFDRPVGIIWGEDDRVFFPIGFARRLCAAFPQSRLRIVPGSRTFVSEDRPHDFADFITEITNTPVSSVA